MAQQDTERLVRQEAPKVADGFRRAARKAHNEAEFRSEAAKVIEAFADAAGLDLHLRQEYTLVNGRADAVYNRFIIEYENPGVLRDKNSYAANQHAIGQVKDYIQGIVRRQRHKEERLAGVAFDGRYYIFVRRRQGVWHVDDPLEVRPASTERFLRTLASLSTERALIPENLVEDFGEGSRIGRGVVPALYEGLNASRNPRVSVLFHQWSRQFSEVCDYDKASKVNVAGIARGYGIKDKKPDPFRLFFCIHTYYAVLIKVLASQVAHFYLTRLGTDLKSVGNKSSRELLGYFRNLEDGALFRQLGITNFLEGDFFSWYLDVWGPAVEGALRDLVNTLADYSLVTLDVDPDTTRDLLKQLYQNLMPKQLRHNLGEYYTPDWLAQRLLNQLDGGTFRGDPDKRLLDPACGSGTFLVLAIKAIKEYGWQNAVPEADLLDKILGNVVGFDLNPLAVISARTNYLLALGDLLQHRRGDITIPVYLCDSILTPSESYAAPGVKDLMEHGVSFNTAVGRFAVPGSLVEARYIDILAGLLEGSVGLRLSPEEFIEDVTRALPLDAEKDRRDCDLLRELYEKLLELDDKGVNGIWARIIKNAFAPLFCGRFDFVAGNPPWVNWEHLPEQYRMSLVPLNQHKYKLFRQTGLMAKSGAAEIDISTLMLYVSADRYLKDGGRLALVITQSLFQTSGGGEGLRRFEIEGGSALRVQHVDDMVELKPFEGAQNRTSVLVVSKGQGTTYPVAYTRWLKKERGGIPQEASLPDVIERTSRLNLHAIPINRNDPRSSWFVGNKAAIRVIPSLVGPSSYRAHIGVHSGGASGVYWVEQVASRPDGCIVVANLADAGRTTHESVQLAVEDKLIYRLVRGRDVAQWRARGHRLMLVPQDPEDPKHAVDIGTMKARFPKAYLYFERFRDALESRPTYKRFLKRQGEPFYALYSVKKYTFAPYKVVWREIASDLLTCVLEPQDGKPVIPDHKLVLIAFDDREEAHFVCATLSSCIARAIVHGYCIASSISTHILCNIPVPTYNHNDSLHRELARLSQEAHHLAESDQSTAEVEHEINIMSGKLWNVSGEEVRQIEKSVEQTRVT